MTKSEVCAWAQRQYNLGWEDARDKFASQDYMAGYEKGKQECEAKWEAAKAKLKIAIDREKETADKKLKTQFFEGYEEGYFAALSKMANEVPSAGGTRARKRSRSVAPWKRTQRERTESPRRKRLQRGDGVGGSSTKDDMIIDKGVAGEGVGDGGVGGGGVDGVRGSSSNKKHGSDGAGHGDAGGGCGRGESAGSKSVGVKHTHESDDYTYTSISSDEDEEEEEEHEVKSEVDFGDL